MIVNLRVSVTHLASFIQITIGPSQYIMVSIRRQAHETLVIFMEKELHIEPCSLPSFKQEPILHRACKKKGKNLENHALCGKTQKKVSEEIIHCFENKHVSWGLGRFC